MPALVIAEAVVFITIALLLQLGLTFAFIQEAIFTRQGTLCRVKCGLAAILYGSIAFVLAWCLIIKPTL